MPPSCQRINTRPAFDLIPSFSATNNKKALTSLRIRLYLLSFIAILINCVSPLVAYCQENPSSTEKQIHPALRYQVDLTATKNDQVQVELRLEKINQETVVFCFPKIVPGIYGAEDFGRFISNFSAFDSHGNRLKIQKQGTNRFKISSAKDLSKISYTVDDCWEKLEATSDFQSKSTKKEKGIRYKSAGCNFERRKRFVINNNCLFGYFQNQKHLPIRIDFTVPEEFLCGTSLKRIHSKHSQKSFIAKNYADLVDNPIVFGLGTSDQFLVGDSTITVTVFGPPEIGQAKQFCRILKPLMEAQAKYIGGKLPVDHYNFLLVWDKGPRHQFIGDGLEHSYSTLILMKGSDVAGGMNFVRDICAHEFFHILIPLTLKSKEVADYDFNQPKQSKHLWLYEGMTEYATIHMPVVEGLSPKDEILSKIRSKMRMSKRFRSDRSLTELSKKAIENQDQYYNFYLKGTLACLCLDIELLKLTDGRWNNRKLISALRKKFGKNRPFDDDRLFDEIAKLTDPRIRTWLKKHIEGTDPLPLQQVFSDVGIEIRKKTLRLRWNKTASPKQLKLRNLWLQSS